MASILTSAFIFQSCLSLGITTMLADQRYVCFLVLPAFVQLYSSTDSSNIFTASSVGQDDSCTICTAQYSGGQGPFRALLIHSIKTLGLVTERGGQYWQEMRPFLAPRSLPTALHQTEQKSKMGRMCARKELKQCPSERKVSRWLW